MFNKYLYSIVDETQRNILQHNILKPVVEQIWEQLLEDYGLRQRLEAAKTSDRSKVLFLEAGSGSGKFLQDLAIFLDQAGLLDGAELIGLDTNLTYVEQAFKATRSLTTGDKLKYYSGDITLPLEHNYSLNLEKKFHFDYISAQVLMQYTPNARQHILRLYNNLKPGGVLYLCDSYMAYEGRYPWIAPNAGIRKFGQLGTKMVRDLNDGQIVAQETAHWLEEAGAEKIATTVQLVPASTSNAYELEALRCYMAIVQSVLPVLNRQGLVTPADEAEIREGFLQINQDSRAQLPFIHTLARKPV